MTCIVGLELGGKVYIGGDSAGVSGLSLCVRADEKVFVSGPFVMGITDSFRMGNLLRYKLSPDEQSSTQTDHEFMCTTFVDAVRVCLKDGGYTTVTNGVEQGGTFLVGYRGQLYSIQPDFQVGMSASPFDAVGCGADIALGAMSAITVNDPTARIEQTLAIAERHCAGVRGPFRVVST